MLMNHALLSPILLIEKQRQEWKQFDQHTLQLRGKIPSILRTQGPDFQHIIKPPLKEAL